MPWLRSLFFYVGFFFLNVLLALLTCLLAFLPGRCLQYLSSIGIALVFKWLRLTCGVSAVPEGEENIPNGPAVFLSNHQSTCETFFLQGRVQPVAPVIKKSLLAIPFFGWTLFLLRAIAIDRGNRKSAMKQVLRKGVVRLRQGYNVVIYPEGTRRPCRELGEFARSGAALAIHAGVPVIPVAHNAGRYWPRKFVKHPGTVTVRFGPPITGVGDSKELTRLAKCWIEEQLEELESDR